MSMLVDRCEFVPGQNIDGRYYVSKVLGEGTYGKVYKVTDTTFGECALKVLRLWEVPSDIREVLTARFEMEFKTGQIDSPYLVRSLNYGNVGGNPYIVMEFCNGGDIERFIGARSERITDICLNILYGLDALHRNAKVHRDLKPENVLIKTTGVAALTDFGIAGDRNHRMTQRNIFGKPDQIFGTYAYMPPEQVNRARGEATVLPTTDIWSFGVLAYQLLTGLLPFGPLDGFNDLAEYQKKGKKGEWNRSALYSVQEVECWMKVIEGCLVPDFKKRFQNIDEVLRYMPKSKGTLRVPEAYFSAPNVVSGFSLHVMHGEEYGKIYKLTDIVRDTGLRMLTVGRQWDNKVFLRETNSALISRYHCTLECSPSDNEWLIRDGQWNRNLQQWVRSTNGTYVNSREVDDKGFYLSVGDIITVGDMKMRFENY